jgi:hypothetical protein
MFIREHLPPQVQKELKNIGWTKDQRGGWRSWRAGDHHAPLRARQHHVDLQPSGGRLGQTAGRCGRRHRHARPPVAQRAYAQERSAQLENQNRVVFDGTTKSERNKANRWRSLMRMLGYNGYLLLRVRAWNHRDSSGVLLRQASA